MRALAESEREAMAAAGRELLEESIAAVALAVVAALGETKPTGAETESDAILRDLAEEMEPANA